MAIAIAAFTNGTGTTNTSFSTAIKTWNAANLYLISLWCWISGGNTTGMTNTFASGSPVNGTPTGPTTTRIDAFKFFGDGTTAAKTITTSVAVDRVQWTIDEVTGADTSGTIVQSVVNNGGSGGPTATLAAFGSASNAAWFSAGNNGGTGQTAEAGYTKSAENTAFFVLSNEYRLGNGDLTPSFTGPTADSWAGVALEIKAATGGGGGGRTTWGRSALDGMSGEGIKQFNPSLSYHQHPMLSLEAYRREQARKHREFMAKVRRAA